MCATLGVGCRVARHCSLRPNKPLSLKWVGHYRSPDWLASPLDEFAPWVIFGFISLPTFYTLASMKLRPGWWTNLNVWLNSQKKSPETRNMEHPPPHLIPDPDPVTLKDDAIMRRTAHWSLCVVSMSLATSSSTKELITVNTSRP